MISKCGQSSKYHGPNDNVNYLIISRRLIKILNTIGFFSTNAGRPPTLKENKKHTVIMVNFDKFLYEAPYYPSPMIIKHEDISAFLLDLGKTTPVGSVHSIHKNEDSYNSYSQISWPNSYSQMTDFKRNISTSSTLGSNKESDTSSKNPTLTQSQTDLNKDRVEGIQRVVEIDIGDPVLILQERVRFVSDVSQLLPLMYKTMDILKVCLVISEESEIVVFY